MHWQSRSACRTVDPDLFLPDEDVPGWPPPERIAALSRTYCADCPVRQQCAAEATLTEGLRAQRWGYVHPSGDYLLKDLATGQKIKFKTLFRLGPRSRR